MSHVAREATLASLSLKSSPANARVWLYTMNPLCAQVLDTYEKRKGNTLVSKIGNACFLHHLCLSVSF